ncbi:hypothetical protein NMY22_g13471 [Coprinellus aureogranulatus]|nr:hypothetical protein NMY22_g13471 [Coprinellus aureogranulatus]
MAGTQTVSYGQFLGGQFFSTGNAPQVNTFAPAPMANSVQPRGVVHHTLCQMQRACDALHVPRLKTLKENATMPPLLLTLAKCIPSCEQLELPTSLQLRIPTFPSTISINVMAPQYEVGDAVIYVPVGDADSSMTEYTGVIRDVFTNPGRPAGRKAQVIEETRYEIEEAITGRLTTIYEKNILRKVPDTPV